MTRILTYAIPASLWLRAPRAAGELDVIQDLIQEVLVARRRMAKRVDEDNQQARFHAACELLEQAVVHQVARGDNRFAVFENDAAYADLVAEDWRKANQDPPHNGDLLGQSVVSPDDMRKHLEVCKRRAHDTHSPLGWLDRRRHFLTSEVLERDGGIVECADFLPEWSTPNIVTGTTASRGSTRPEPSHQFGGGRIPVYDILRQRITSALASDDIVNMNNQSHVVITKVMNEFVTVCDRNAPGTIRVGYGDGSEGPGYPLRCLPPADPNREEIVMPMALMSMRHLLLDEHVVVNWLRNAEIDQSSTLARSDEYCYERSVHEFDALRRHATDRRLCIHLFHTGYEPAVVGVYRAAVESIRDHGDWMRIVPYFFVEDGFELGESWPPLADAVNPIT